MKEAWCRIPSAGDGNWVSSGSILGTGVDVRWQHDSGEECQISNLCGGDRAGIMDRNNEAFSGALINLIIIVTW